jgi:hypothetical protein
MRRTLLLVLLLAAVLATGCKKKRDSGERPAGTSASGEQSVAGEEEARTERRQMRMKDRRQRLRERMNLAPITVEEVAPLLPTLPDATPVGQPGSLTGGRQVKSVLCAKSNSAETTTKAVVAELEKLGFGSLRSRPHPRNPDVATVSGEKPPFRVGATIQRGPYADCPAEGGKAKIVFSYFKRLPAAAKPDGEAQSGAPTPND